MSRQQYYELIESDNDFSYPNCKVCDAMMQSQHVINSQAKISQSDNQVNENTKEVDGQNIVERSGKEWFVMNGMGQHR